jgi:molecular chaperone Hsp33
MLRENFTPEERSDMAVNGEIEVVCEFCSADYHFRPEEFEDHAGHTH